MKKLSLVFFVIFSFFSFSYAQKQKPFNAGFLKGPTGIGATFLLEKNESKDSLPTYNCTIYSSPDEIVSHLLSGQLDVACLPTNVLATLYNKTNGKVKIAAINTLGMLCILSNENINSIKDLKGKTLFVAGKGSSTECVLTYLLRKNGIENNVNIEWQSEHLQVIADAKLKKSNVVLLPEPFATLLLEQCPNFKKCIDFEAEWENLTQNRLPMGALAVRADFYKNEKSAFYKFMNDYQMSVQKVNENVNETAVLTEKFGILQSEVAKKTIPNCNIVFISGKKMAFDVKNFLEICNSFKPELIGGKMPNEDFYIK